MAPKYPEICKGKDLIKDIESCSSDFIKKILIVLIENNRNENNSPNLEECLEKSEKLKHKGVKRWEGIKIFCENFYGKFTDGIGVYI